MVRYITRRLLWAIATLVIVSFVTFVIFYVLPPGDPAVLRAGHFPNPAMLAHIRHVLGVDRPFWAQYIDIGFLLGGAVVVETVFNIPGVGRLAYDGIHEADLPIIQSTVQFGAYLVVIANLIVDVAYAFLDPRVRYS